MLPDPGDDPGQRMAEDIVFDLDNIGIREKVEQKRIHIRKRLGPAQVEKKHSRRIGHRGSNIQWSGHSPSQGFGKNGFVRWLLEISIEHHAYVPDKNPAQHGHAYRVCRQGDQSIFAKRGQAAQLVREIVVKTNTEFRFEFFLLNHAMT
jgi:hypothetical protein